MTKIKIGSDFSGVGAFNQALIRLGIAYEEVFACDMDKYARQTFVLNYGEPKYYPKDVYEREIPKESLDIYMTSPPCQSFSMAGKRLGKEDQRGILFFNSLEFIRENKPRYFIFENVKGLLSHDKVDKNQEFGRTFQEWINYLGGKSINGVHTFFPYEDAVPYHIYFQVLNAKHYGIPQNRERIFIIGIRDDEDNDFQFPKPFPLEKRLKDVLESEVDEKYFLSDKMVDNLITYNKRQVENKTGFSAQFRDVETTKVMGALKVGGGGKDDLVKVGFINQDTQASQVFSEKVTSPNICAGTHGYALGYVETEIGTWRTHEDGKGFRGMEDNLCPTIPARAREDGSGQPVVKIGAIRGLNPQNPKSRETGLETEQMLEINENGTSNALTTVQKDNVVVIPAPIVEYQLTGGKWDKTHEQSGRVYDKNGISPTIHTMGGGNQEPKVFADEIIVLNDATHSQQRIYSQEGISPSILSGSNGGGQNPCKHLTTTQRIRRLTPAECFRLMDFNPEFIWDVSDSQAYKQAGNSICVGVLVEIIKKLKL